MQCKSGAVSGKLSKMNRRGMWQSRFFQVRAQLRCCPVCAGPRGGCRRHSDGKEARGLHCLRSCSTRCRRGFAIFGGDACRFFACAAQQPVPHLLQQLKATGSRGGQAAANTCWRHQPGAREYFTPSLVQTTSGERAGLRTHCRSLSAASRPVCLARR